MEELEATDARWDARSISPTCKIASWTVYERNDMHRRGHAFAVKKPNHCTGASSECAPFQDRAPRPQSINVPWSMHPFIHTGGLSRDLTATPLRQSALSVTQQWLEIRPADCRLKDSINMLSPTSSAEAGEGAICQSSSAKWRWNSRMLRTGWCCNPFPGKRTNAASRSDLHREPVCWEDMTLAAETPRSFICRPLNLLRAPP